MKYFVSVKEKLMLAITILIELSMETYRRQHVCQGLTLSSFMSITYFFNGIVDGIFMLRNQILPLIFHWQPYLPIEYSILYFVRNAL
jgi:hypothetical protein